MLQKAYEFFTKRVGINEELTLTGQGIQILTLLGSTVLPAAEGAAPKQFYETRILKDSVGESALILLAVFTPRVREVYERERE